MNEKQREFVERIVDKYGVYIFNVRDHLDFYEVIATENPKQEDFEKEVKKGFVFDLSVKVNDLIVNRFLDTESDEMLDLKLEVLLKLAKGKTPHEIGDDFYKILELYPEEGVIWD